MTSSILNQSFVQHALAMAMKNTHGNTANYIPELARIPADLTAIAIKPIGQPVLHAANMEYPEITLQSTSKLIPLIGLLEEFGPNEVFSWVRVEPSGTNFASLARLDQFGPKPTNPMLNSGAIALCSHIPGNGEEKLAWLDKWVNALFGERLYINNLVLSSERRTGDRNRSLAYLLKSNKMLLGNVEEVLEVYFSLCSYQALVEQAVALPALLANQGVNDKGQRVFSADTAKQVIAIMSTCGMYNESGTHMLKTGIPAKSGVSGYILAAAPGKAGIATLSPRVNKKGTSVRGELMLEYLSEQLKWHFGLG